MRESIYGNNHFVTKLPTFSLDLLIKTLYYM